MEKLTDREKKILTLRFFEGKERKEGCLQVFNQTGIGR